jgi:hypothetical protein
MDDKELWFDINKVVITGTDTNNAGQYETWFTYDDVPYFCRWSFDIYDGYLFWFIDEDSGKTIEAPKWFEDFELCDDGFQEFEHKVDLFNKNLKYAKCYSCKEVAEYVGIFNNTPFCHKCIAGMHNYKKDRND